MFNHAVSDFCHLLKALTNSLDPDRAQRWDWTGLKLFDTLHDRIPLKILLKKANKSMKNTQHAKS